MTVKGLLLFVLSQCCRGDRSSLHLLCANMSGHGQLPRFPVHKLKNGNAPYIFGMLSSRVLAAD